MPDDKGYDELHPAGIAAIRAVASLLLLTSGIIVLGALYGTDDLLLQLLAMLAFLPFMGWYLLSSRHLTPQSWTGSVQFLVALAIPPAAIGAPSWWLLVAGQRLTDCVVLWSIETEDNRGLRYEHDIRCGDDELHYTARGDPAGERGQLMDMLTDPHGILAPLPSHVAPTGFGWATVATLTAALVVAVAEVTRRLGRHSSGSTGPEHPDA